MKARVIVTLKSGVLDPQGKAIEGALASLGIAGIGSVRQGKVFDVELDGADPAAVERILGEACEKLLANTVIENYRVELDGAAAPAQARTAPAGSERPAPAGGERPAAAGSGTPAPAAKSADAAASAEMPAEGHP